MPRFRLTSTPPLEASEQAALFQWATAMSRQESRLRWLFAIPNGTAAISPAEAVKAKRTGRKKGVPDVFLPVPSRGYHGLFIELKRLNGQLSDLSDEQALWIQALTEQGYKTAVCFGWIDAAQTIKSYLRIGEDQT